MRKFSQFSRKCMAASVLMLALACSAFAGDVQYPNVTSEAPATNGDMQHPTATGEYVTETVLDLWQSMLSMF